MVIGHSWVSENAFQHALTKQMVACPLGATKHCVLLECGEVEEESDGKGWSYDRRDCQQ